MDAPYFKLGMARMKSHALKYKRERQTNRTSEKNMSHHGFKSYFENFLIKWEMRKVMGSGMFCDDGVTMGVFFDAVG